jgi:hypothetical protein
VGLTSAGLANNLATTDTRQIMDIAALLGFDPDVVSVPRPFRLSFRWRPGRDELRRDQVRRPEHGCQADTT